MSYTFGTEVFGEFDEVVSVVTEELGVEGFGVLTTIDVAATLRAKLGKDREPYTILGACKPVFADRALQHDPRIGALLPCNVVVRDDGDSVRVDFMDPIAALGIVSNDEIGEIAEEVRAQLASVRDRVAARPELATRR